MTLGEKVVYARDPLLYGVGVLNRVLKDGRHEVIFDPDGERYTEAFSRGELLTVEQFLDRESLAKALA